MTDLNQTVSLAQATHQGSFVYKGVDCDVSVVVRSDIALVTFDNLASIDDRPQDGEWQPWLAQRAENLGFSIVGLQSHHKDWYRTAEPAEHLKTLVAVGFFQQFSQVLFVGASMGGFAALCFAGIVPGARVLAFSPQSTLNRRIAPFERRYPWPYRKFDWETPTYLDAAQELGSIAEGHIFYDPHVREDKRHAERLAALHIEQISIPFSGHTLIRTIVKCGALEHLLKTLAVGNALDLEFWRLMRHRRDDPVWSKQFLRKVIARGHGPMARQACDAMYNTHGHPFARRLKRKMRQQIRQEKALVSARKAERSFWTDGLSETNIRAKVPVFIDSTEFPSCLPETVDWFSHHGFHNVMVLCAQSKLHEIETYVQSKDFKRKARLVSLTEYPEHDSAMAQVVEDQVNAGGFVFTTPRLKLPDLPAKQLIKGMFEMGMRHGARQVGLTLSLDPALVHLDQKMSNGKTLEENEKKYRKNKIEGGVFEAPVEDTFLVFVPEAVDTATQGSEDKTICAVSSIRVAQKGFVALNRAWLHPSAAEDLTAV